MTDSCKRFSDMDLRFRLKFRINISNIYSYEIIINDLYHLYSYEIIINDLYLNFPFFFRFRVLSTSQLKAN